MALSSFLRDASGQSASMLRNVLQGMGATQATPVEEVVVTAPRPQTLQVPIEGPSASALPALVAPPRPEPPRRSMLQRFGGLADALAVAGEAKPLYQPTLDARQKSADAAMTQDRERLGMVMKGYQAAITNGMPEAQARSLIPQLMQSVNMSPEAIEANIATINSSPEALQGMLGLSGALREPAKHGMNVQYATGPDGQVMAYTVNDQGGISRLEMPEGFSPTLPLQAVNAGGQTVMANRLNAAPTGAPIQHTVRPDTVANNDARFNIARLNAANQAGLAQLRAASAERIAQLKAEGKDEKAVGGAEAALGALDDLEAEYMAMHERGETITPDNSPVQNMINRGWASGAGQLIGGSIGSERQTSLDNIEGMRRSLLQAIVNATGMSAQQLNSNFELDNYLKTLTDPRASYEANRAAAGRVRAIIAGSAAPAARPSASNTGGSAVGRSSRRIDVDAPSRPAAQQSAPRVVNW